MTQSTEQGMNDEEFDALEKQYHASSAMNLSQLTASECVTAMSRHAQLSAAYHREYGIRMGWRAGDEAKP